MVGDLEVTCAVVPIAVHYIGHRFVIVGDMLY
jgi:hypothetical protein